MVFKCFILHSNICTDSNQFGIFFPTIFHLKRKKVYQSACKIENEANNGNSANNCEKIPATKQSVARMHANISHCSMQISKYGKFLGLVRFLICATKMFFL